MADNTEAVGHAPRCRFDKHPLRRTFVDLGMSPLSNSYVKPERLREGEMFYPLHAYLCDHCFLVQLEEFESPGEIFSDYSYFSSFSDSWLQHAEYYTEQMVQRFGFGSESSVIEIASNDGYLLQYFAQRGVPVLGIEPAQNVAEHAGAKGIPTLVRFFGVELAEELVSQGKQADLLLGNNVLAHVPDLNDFVAGMKVILKPGGVITMEFPHLLKLMQQNQFDTIYHEHFSYFSFATASRVFAAHDIHLFDVEELPTHGGSLRIYGCHTESAEHGTSDRVGCMLAAESDAGLDRTSCYEKFGEQVRRTKRELLKFLMAQKEMGKTVVGYGAPAKGNTLLNYCGVKPDLLQYTVDRSPHKQGSYLPGTRIPIYAPDKIVETRPDYVLILPWNIRVEVMEQMRMVRDWGGQFVVPIPEVKVLE